MISIENKIITFIKIILILIILGFIIYNFFILKDDSDEFNSMESIVNTSSENTEEKETVQKIKVYVTGQVNSPGVLELYENSRIEDAINLAGGLTPDANLQNVNLAFVLEDGQKLYIPSIYDNTILEYITTENGTNILETPKGTSNTSKININKADIENLKQLPGVGDSLAERIFNYRKENGNFKSIEDLKNVSGIGDKKFESLKEYISIWNYILNKKGPINWTIHQKNIIP